MAVTTDAPPSSTGRSILAVVIGFVLIGVLAHGTNVILKSAAPGAYDVNGRGTTATLELLMHAYVFTYATFGCWLAARLAPNRPMRHAIILGILGLVFNIAGSAAMWDTAQLWSHLLGIGLVMPAAWLGGWLRERQTERGGAAVISGATA